MSRDRYRAYKAQQAAERVLMLIDTELRLGTERRHVDILCEYAEVLLRQCEPTVLVTVYCQRLATIVRGLGPAPVPRPSSPPSLRIVK